MRKLDAMTPPTDEAPQHQQQHLDVMVSGLLFQDLVFGLPTAPRSGTEVWASGYAESPGGIANFAVALARLGLATGLATCFGTDDRGDRLWQTLRDTEGIDLSRSARIDGWATPLTVALAYDGDRALVTHGGTPPLSADDLLAVPPDTKAVAAHIGPWPNEWLPKARANGSLVFADVGWDPTEGWDPAVLDQLDHVDVFLPNATEAMSYTRTTTPADALAALAERVGVAVISDGARGAIAMDAGTGERVDVPAERVNAIDTTGAGDVFAAGFIAATLWQFPLIERVRFANHLAAQSVTRLGGADAAPYQHELAAYLEQSGQKEGKA